MNQISIKSVAIGPDIAHELISGVENPDSNIATYGLFGPHFGTDFMP